MYNDACTNTMNLNINIHINALFVVFVCVDTSYKLLLPYSFQAPKVSANTIPAIAHAVGWVL